MEGAKNPAGNAVGSKVLDAGRLGQAFILLGGILLIIHIALTAMSLIVPAESSWMIFNLWGINRFIMITVVCCVFIAVGWMLCKKAGCEFLRNEAEPVPGEKDALSDVRKP